MYLVGEDSAVLESEEDLLSYFQEACKPSSEWMVGTEHEMIGVLASGAPLQYHGEQGLLRILKLLESDGWTAVREGENIIALTHGESQVSIEPGAQLEHAARPLCCSEDLEDELHEFLRYIEKPSSEIGVQWISAGFRPWGTLDDVPWVPKYRYDIMREYLPTRGQLAHEMMKRTATVQVNLDYSSEEDAHSKMRAAMSTTSLLTAIYANSPIIDGEISDFESYRAHIWTLMDPDRCGMLPFVFDEGDFFQSYTQWALDVPMFFVHRDTYIDAKGMTFRQFMKEGFQDTPATMDDWGLHLSTLFPDARMKKFIEIRGCDANSFDMTVALGAFAAGLLYDRTACEEACSLTQSWSWEERLEFAAAVNRRGILAPLPKGQGIAADMADELLAIVRAGLRRRDPSEIPFLEPIEEVVVTHRTHASRLVELWKKYDGRPDKIVPYLSYYG